MVSADAAARPTVRRTDFDEIVATLRGAFGGIGLRRDDEQDCGLSLRSAHQPGLTATRCRLSGVAGGSRGGEQPEPAYLTGLLLGGRLRMWTRWEEVDTARPFLHPEPVDTELGRPDVATLALSRSIVEERARALTGSDEFQLRFSGTAPIDATMDRVWRDTMAYTARTVEALGDDPDATIAHAELRDLAATMLLRTFPNTTLDAMNRHDVTGPRGAALRRALRYIDDNLDLPIAVHEIAEAARLSCRGLYATFQRDLQTTPMAYLREARLEAARDELRDADPGVATVAVIALRWGFPHTARFTDRYVARFGEAPEQTLDR